MLSQMLLQMLPEYVSLPVPQYGYALKLRLKLHVSRHWLLLQLRCE